ncbi:MAG TPA: F0F1 ATP synthase subunit B [Thermoleophilaceae bacterium]|nr:F0F1 ATP synthase subunit B [Thermoleophilaceae bacterium]
MDAFTDIAMLVLAAAEHGAAEEEGGSFLVSPNVGLMLWTLIAFGVSMLILKKFAFPAIGEALDKRAATIDESLNAAVRTKEEAEELLEEYRARLKEAREQAEDIVARSRKAADGTLEEAKSAAKEYGEEQRAATIKEIEAAKQLALDDIRKEVADLTVIATEKVTRKSLDGDDHRRLIEEALSEVDFTALAGSEGRS